MRVFISWSGPRSQELAQALHEWMPLVLHYVEPWLSQTDVAAGERWAEALAKGLETSNFGIICLTRENVGEPWILFEAGSIAKSLQGGRVIPLLLDLELSEISGPLAQFQAKKVDKEGLNEVVVSVNHAAEHPVAEERVKQLFEALWPEMEKRVASVPKQQAGAKPIRTQHEILEELVSGVRSVDARLRNVEETVSGGDIRSKRRRRPRLHPMELTHMVGTGPDDPIVLLVLASMVREEFPWLYELGIEAYRAAKAGGATKEAKDALRRFRRAAEVVMHGPWPLEESGFDPRMFEMLLMDLEHRLSGEGSAEEEPAPEQRSTQEAKEG